MTPRLIAVMLAALLGPAYAAIDSPEPADDEFHFVVLGDSQFDDPATFNRTIDQVRMLRPAFVIQVGDLIDGYQDDLAVIKQQWARFRDQIGPLGPIPYLAAAGNHDLYNGQRQVDPRLEALFEAEWGDLYYQFRYKNSAFFVLNSDSSVSANGIDDKQLAWLRAALKRNRSQHTFVLLHRPPRMMVNGDALHELFVANRVHYVIYGHLHHYHHELRDGVHYVMTNNSGNSGVDVAELGAFDHQLHVAVRDDEVSIATIGVDAVRPIDFVDPFDNNDFFMLTQRLTPAAVTAERLPSGAYAFDLAFANPIRREIDVYVSCSSTDNRWKFEPEAIASIRLVPEQALTINLEAGFDASRVPESRPSCRVEVPFQTATGQWFRVKRSVNITTL